MVLAIGDHAADGTSGRVGQMPRVPFLPGVVIALDLATGIVY